MNNTQFRKLVLETPNRKPNSKDGVGATPSRSSAIPAALGSRMRSSIPMTPRSVMGSSGVDFARQLAERDQGERPTKKFRSSAAPKGTKLASGYRDRTQERVSIEEDDKASRVKALEDMLRLQQIDQNTFEKLRDQITGGDIAATHLVKGLDYKLLERVRKGEDVLSGSSVAGSKKEDEKHLEANQESFDEELEKLEDREIVPLAKEKTAKKGEMAPPPETSTVAGRKRSRNEIIAELKASRQAAAAAAKVAAQPSLGPKFRKLGEKREKSRIEHDEKGREVLITVDEDGRVKRKVKKEKVHDAAPTKTSDLLMPDKDAKPLGMDVPEIPAAIDSDKDNTDIFEDAGADYDPLGGIEAETSDSSDSEEAVQNETEKRKRPSTDAEPESPASNPPSLSPSSSTIGMPPPPSNPSTTAQRNYFNTPTTTTQDPPDPSPAPNPLTDPTILAALKKASSITLTDATLSSSDDPEEASRLARRQKLLSSHDRDAEDMDLGFGSSRFGDDAEEGEEGGGGKKMKLSVWGDEKGEEGDEGGLSKAGGKGARKRGGGGGGGGGGEKKKKRQGDKESAKDVLSVLERRNKKKE